MAATVTSVAQDVASSLSLDALQESTGFDATGKKALYDSLDLTYVSPRVIGA